MEPTEEARRLRDEYEAAMDQAQGKRTEYHRAVTELHRSGMPMREIAKQLGISHQRVHQIVTGEPQRRGHRGKVVGGAVAGIILAACLGLSILANIRADHPLAFHRTPPRLVAVPNVVGMTGRQAFSALGQAGLQAEGVRSAHSNIVPAGSILSERPSVGARVRVGSGVSLVESDGAQ